MAAGASRTRLGPAGAFGAQLEDGDDTGLRAAAWRRRLHGLIQGPAGPARPGVSLPPRPVGTRLWRWRMSSRWLCCCRPPAPMVAWCALACFVWSATVYGGGGWSLPHGCGTAALVYGGSSQFGRPRNSCHGDTTMVTSIPWWRLLVGGKMGGALRIVLSCGFFGGGGCHLDTDAVTLVSVANPS